MTGGRLGELRELGQELDAATETMNVLVAETEARLAAARVNWAAWVDIDVGGVPWQFGWGKLRNGWHLVARKGTAEAAGEVTVLASASRMVRMVAMQHVAALEAALVAAGRATVDTIRGLGRDEG